MTLVLLTTRQHREIRRHTYNTGHDRDQHNSQLCTTEWTCPVRSTAQHCIVLNVPDSVFVGVHPPLPLMPKPPRLPVLAENLLVPRPCLPIALLRSPVDALFSEVANRS